jgi:hypothetical protein
VGEQVVHVLAAHLGGPVAQDLRARRVDQHDPALVVDPDDALGGRAQDQLDLPLLAAQLGLDVEHPGQVAHDQQGQLGLVLLGQLGRGDLGREDAAVGAPRGHPLRRPAHRAARADQVARVYAGGPGGQRGRAGTRGGHGAADPGQDLGDRLAQQPFGALALEQGQRGGVGVDDRARAVHEDQGVGQRVEYRGEPSGAPDRGSVCRAHRDVPPVALVRSAVGPTIPYVGRRRENLSTAGRRATAPELRSRRRLPRFRHGVNPRP